MNDDGVSLLKALQEARQSSGRRHDSKALRARAAAWYRERRAQGMSCRDIGAELGIHPLQLARWARQEPGPRFRQFELVIPAESEGRSQSIAAEMRHIQRCHRPHRSILAAHRMSPVASPV